MNRNMRMMSNGKDLPTKTQTQVTLAVEFYLQQRQRRCNASRTCGQQLMRLTENNVYIKYGGMYTNDSHLGSASWMGIASDCHKDPRAQDRDPLVPVFK